MHTLVGLYWLSRPGISERTISHLFGIGKGSIYKIKRRFLEAITLTFGGTTVPSDPHWIGLELCVPNRPFGRGSREAFSNAVMAGTELALTAGDGIHIELEGPDEDFLPPGIGLKSPWFNRKGRRSTNVLGVVAIPASRSEIPKFIFCYAGLEGYCHFS